MLITPDQSKFRNNQMLITPVILAEMHHNNMKIVYHLLFGRGCNFLSFFS